MALKLMDPINQMPFFQANQVLTYNHLNELAAYLYQQERYTRNKLIGSGIVCGLTFSWKPIALGNAEVIIDEGCAITSAGYLIVFKQPVNRKGEPVPYTHKRNFTRLADFEPFKSVMGNNKLPIWELITKDIFNTESDVPKSILKDNDKTNRVLILLYDIEALNIAKCLDESCDDKGKIYQYTPRPLLVPVSIIDKIIDAPVTQPFFTEPGRAAKGKESLLFETDYLFLKNLFKAGNLSNVTAPADLIALFTAPCLDPELDIFRDKMDTLISKFPWIFDTQFNCMKTEVPALGAQTLGALFKTRAQAFRNNPANNNFIQYLYDFLRDVTDAYNELYKAVADLVGECGGNEFMHPFHVMLGLPTTNDTLACYQEDKYSEHNFKYRHYFVPSPVMDGQFMLYENVQNLFKRLVRIIANFSRPTSKDISLSIIPSKDYDRQLGERAIPYFYSPVGTDSIKSVWNYDLTRRNKITRIKGYRLGFTQDQLLDEDCSKNDFYRIEGHIGSPGPAVQTALDALRVNYNLPFTVTSVSIQSNTTTLHCSFPDLEEEYNYYRDRVLGYLREIRRWLESVRDVFVTNPILKRFYDVVFRSVLRLREILNARCIESFNYRSYKEIYTEIWEAVFQLYVEELDSTKNTAKANQTLNSVLNIFSIVFFRPIYKIWYMFKYRMGVLSQSQLSSLNILASKTTGLEHLAGVRRGETFLLVTDSTQADAIVADFNLPDLLGCSCDCKAEPCDGKNTVLVSPMQKPIIMVVDYSYTKENAYMKSKAFLDIKNKLYFLELDSMGFYKADSTIAPLVKVALDTGAPFPDLTARWEDEKLVLRYRINDDVKSDGFFSLMYEMGGNFDEGRVRGRLYLFVIGRVTASVAPTFDVPVSGRVKSIYPYDKLVMKKVKPDMKFDAVTKTRTIGGERVNVYTTPNGNELGIYKDRSGLPFIKVIKAQTPGVEEVPFIMESAGSFSKSSVSVNVIDRTDKLTSDSVSGLIKGEDGQPLKDVKLTSSSGREAITNEKGEYTLEGLKTGEVITVEKQGYKTGNIQVNSNMAAELKLDKAPMFSIGGLENLKLPGNLGTLAEGLNLTALKNFMK